MLRMISSSSNKGIGRSSSITFERYASPLDLTTCSRMAYHYCTKQLAGALDTLQKSEAPDAGKVRELARELEAHAAEDKRLDMYVRLLMRGRVSRTIMDHHA